ncbi:MAG: AzlD domain-containing protein [Clostridia bacterium]|nr:AzlD domain-containing protein [Clostridia bacterium]
MMHNIYIYILGMALVTYAIRVLPLTLIRKKIENRLIRSFLYYVPYVTLAVMTFPAIIDATQYPIAGAIALLVAIVFAFFGRSLFFVAISSSLTVLVVELIIKLLTK